MTDISAERKLDLDAAIRVGEEQLAAHLTMQIVEQLSVTAFWLSSAVRAGDPGPGAYFTLRRASALQHIGRCPRDRR